MVGGEQPLSRHSPLEEALAAALAAAPLHPTVNLLLIPMQDYWPELTGSDVRRIRDELHEGQVRTAMQQSEGGWTGFFRKIGVLPEFYGKSGVAIEGVEEVSRSIETRVNEADGVWGRYTVAERMLSGRFSVSGSQRDFDRRQIFEVRYQQETLSSNYLGPDVQAIVVFDADGRFLRLGSESERLPETLAAGLPEELPARAEKWLGRLQHLSWQSSA